MIEYEKAEGSPMKELVRVNDLLKQVRISRATLFRWMNQGLPHKKIGRIVLFDPPEVAAWIERSGTETSTPRRKRKR
jgi:predicted DNA-binding transcriptional regulator AlpA